MKILVVGCQHGHEQFGLLVRDSLKSTPIKGVDFLLGNPRAVELSTRYIDTDLNRSFNLSEGYEAQLAKQINKIMNKYDYVLDIHTTTTELSFVPIVSSLGAKTLNVLNTLDQDNIVFMADNIANGSLIGAFGDGAVSLEFGEKNADLNVIRELLDNLSRQIKLPRKERDIYYVEDVITGGLPGDINNFQYVDSLDGYAILPNEGSYKGYAGFIARKRDKLLI